MEKYKDSKLSVEERVEDLVERMTIQEKVGQLNQRLYGFGIYQRMGEEILLSDEFKKEVERFSGLGVLYGLYRADPWAAKDEETGLKGTLARKAFNQIQKYVMEHSRLSIPVMHSTECPHGHQALDGYLLPVNLAVGATFHPELLYKAGKICGRQLKEMGVSLALISTLDILRDPRWGRSEECYGEDPYLAARMGEAIVKAVQEEGVAVVAKHFLAQGEGTGGINASAARIGERELREIHLPAAEACAKAGVMGVMAAYNEIDGVFCHVNKKMLNEVLREEFGFRGAVMADGVAIDNLDAITGDNIKSGAEALKSGVDISLWDNGFAKLDQALEKGYIVEEDLNRALRRVLSLKMELGLFEHPFLESDTEASHYNCESYTESLALARESVVLLKNENHILPLAKKQRIAVIGPNADALYHQLGDYTPPVKADKGITVKQGMELIFSESELYYSNGEDLEEAASLAEKCDVAVLVLGGSSSRFGGAAFDINGAAIKSDSMKMDCGEGVDLASLTLPGNQTELFLRIKETGVPIVSILIQGRPYIIEEIADQSDALMISFYPGPMGGKAIAELLSGVYSPSGRLPVSIPRHAGQLPVSYNYKKSYPAMQYCDLNKNPRFTFGEGFGYTDITFLEAKLSHDTVTSGWLLDNFISVSAVIQNTGDKDEHSVLQLYTARKSGSVVSRVRELKAFHKVRVEKHSELSVNLKLTGDAFALWDREMKHVIESGTIELILMDCGIVLWTGKLLIE